MADSIIQSPGLFDRIFNSVPDAIVLVDVSRCIIRTNPAFSAMFGYKEEEVRGQSTALLYLSDAEYTQQGHERYNTDPRREQSIYLTRYRRRNGTSFTAETTGGVLRNADDDVVGYIGFIRDVSQREQARTTLQTLFRISSTQEKTAAEKIREMLQAGLHHFGMTHALVSHIEDDTYRVVHAVTPEEAVRPGAVFSTDETYCAQTIAADGPTGFHHSGQSGIRTHPCYRNFGLEAYLGAPLLVKGRRFGTVNFSAFAPRAPFDETDYRIIELFSNWIGYELALDEEMQALKAAHEEMTALATTDELTGVANRREFLRQAHREWARHQRHDIPFALLMIDADRFKQINDTYGHSAGDRVLKSITDRIRKIIRPNDVIGRLGGEEFSILLPDTSMEGGRALAERVRARMAATPVRLKDGTPVNVTLSIGVAAANGEMSGFDDLFGLADKNVYRAKHAGRNMVVHDFA